MHLTSVFFLQFQSNFGTPQPVENPVEKPVENSPKPVENSFQGTHYEHPKGTFLVHKEGQKS